MTESVRASEARSCTINTNGHERTATHTRVHTQCVCVLLLQDLLQSCSRGGGGEWRTCAMRDDEPRPVWMSLPIMH